MSSQFLYRSRVTSCVTPSLLGTTPILLPIYMQMTEDDQVSIADAVRREVARMTGCYCRVAWRTRRPRLAFPHMSGPRKARRAAPAGGS